MNRNGDSHAGRQPRSSLVAVLDAYEPATANESRDLSRVRALLADGDPWTRSSPLHVTGSAIILHPSSGSVLLRWHHRVKGWLQVGGHADAGETSPYAIALREAQEETGLTDLTGWPDPQNALVLQIVIVPVPAGSGEASHEHADIRYLLATERPGLATPELDTAPVRWLDLSDAISATSEDNLRDCLERVAQIRSRHLDREVAAADVVEIIGSMEDNGIRVWIDGGWGVDALLGRQTRRHKDLDVAVQKRDVPKMRELLAARSFREKGENYARPWNYILVDDAGRELDLHIIELDTQGNGLYGGDSGESFTAHA